MPGGMPQQLELEVVQVESPEKPLVQCDPVDLCPHPGRRGAPCDTTRVERRAAVSEHEPVAAAAAEQVRDELLAEDGGDLHRSRPRRRSDE